MSARILALDLASVVGFAHNADPRGPRTGSKSFAPPAAGSKNRLVWMPGDRWSAFTEWLNTTVEVVRPSLIVIEQPLAEHKSAQAARVAFGMVTRVEEAAARRRIPVREVHNSTLKAWATGSGRADKAAMVAAAQGLYPGVFTSDDEADSALLLAFAEAGFPEPAPKSKSRRAQREQLPIA